MKYSAIFIFFSFISLSNCQTNNSNNLTQSEDMENQKTEQQANLESITLAGGCFWCIEAVFNDVKGVQSAESGYSGGMKETADYKTVSTGNTKHTEAVKVVFDSTKVSLEEILEIFWHVHDPTTLNRQGNDVGPQYRSAVFYNNENQKTIIEKSIKEVASEIWPDPIVTEVAPFEAFYKAENYHQDYYDKTGDRNPYCTYVITPKVQKFKKLFTSKVKHKQ